MTLLTGIAVLRLKKKPVNSLNLELLTDLTIALDKLESDKRCEGLVLTSVPYIKLLLLRFSLH